MVTESFIGTNGMGLILPTLSVALLLVFTISNITEVLSRLINTYLRVRYPIRSLDGKGILPTCPYRWPNGQGDVEKFLEGLKTSHMWRKEHGRVYRIWSGTQGEIVISRPEDVRRVFNDSNAHVKAHFNNSGYLFGQLLGHCLGELSESEWSKLHQVLAPAFTHKRSTEYVETIRQDVESFVSTQISDSSCNFLSPSKDLRLLPFKSVASILYGSMPADLHEELISMIDLRESLLMRAFTGNLTRHSWSSFLPLQVNYDLANFQNRWTAFNERVMSCSASAGASHGDLEVQVPAYALFSAVTAGSIPRIQALQTLDEMLFANLDVMIGALAWQIVMIAASKDAQTDILDEIKAARSSSDPPTADSQMTSYISRSDTMLAASCLESSRLRPIAAFSVPQAAPTDRVVAGKFVIPAGTHYIVDAQSLNLAEEVWGVDAMEYKPSRWLDKARDKDSDKRYSFWRFGFGPRQCLGKYVAELMLRSVTAHLVENFVLEVEEGASTSERDPGSWIAMPKARVVLTHRG